MMTRPSGGAPLLDRLAREANEEVGGRREAGGYRDPPGPPASPAAIAEARARLVAAEATERSAEATYKQLAEQQQNAIRNNFGDDIVRRLSARVERAARALLAASARTRAARRTLQDRLRHGRP